MDREEYPAARAQREAGRCKASPDGGEGAREPRAGNGPPVWPTVTGEMSARQPDANSGGTTDHFDSP